nr:MAK10-like protein [Tanacetum cinerariifolium]
QDVPSTSDRRLIELENQVQRLMEAHLTPTQPTKVNKITTPCEICNGPHDNQYCMKNPEQAFFEYVSSRTNKAGGSISTWEDLSTRFLAQFFPSGRTTKLHNDILMFQQHHGESLSEDGGKLRDLNPKESWAILEDLALYDNEKPTQVNKITTPCEICNGPHDNQYCMKNPEQAFFEYVSSRTNKAGGMISEFMASQDARLFKFEADFKQQQSEMTNKIDTALNAITDRIAGTLPSDTVKNPKSGTHPVSSACSYPVIDPQCSSHPSTSINAIKLHFNDAIIEP